MTTLVYLIPVALFLGGMSLLAFLWALRSGQYEDLDGAGARILLDPEDERAQPVTRRDWRPTARSPE
jgi:cbb3-type cytochrome oxidase maturation protein